MNADTLEQAGQAENGVRLGGTLDNILKSRPLRDREFEKISAMVYDLCRINLHLGKKELVQARLNKRLRLLGIDSYKEYLKYLEEDTSGLEMVAMVDALTTNLTYFFREPDHFDHLKNEILKEQDFSRGGRFRIWCAGCSSGEEAYSLAMTVRESVPEKDLAGSDIKILATDISTKVIAAARQGVFSRQRFRDTPAALRDRYFTPLPSRPGGETLFRANPDLRKTIAFHIMNLMEPWPVKGPFDVIFCRNVMIYFDKRTQNELISRFHEILKPGGVFMVGHSESLTGINHDFSYVKPSIYQKARYGG